MNLGLHASALVVTAGRRRLLDSVSIALQPGTLTAVIGPNGAGKSTLLKVLSGDLTPQSGVVLLNGRSLSGWNAAERALQRAVLPQTPELAFSFRAWDVVELGRHPHLRHATLSEDHVVVAEAMTATETSGLAQQDCTTLSGGEMHRTHFARALAQIWRPLPDGRARVLLLDEPTASLDLYHQHAILERAAAVARAGSAVLIVLHDLNLAAAYADTVMVLAQGRLDASGSAAEVLTAERIARIWRVQCAIEPGESGRVQVRVMRQRPSPSIQRQASLI